MVASRLGFSYKDVKEWYYLSSRDILKFRVCDKRWSRGKETGRKGRGGVERASKTGTAGSNVE